MRIKYFIKNNNIQLYLAKVLVQWTLNIMYVHSVVFIRKTTEWIALMKCL